MPKHIVLSLGVDGHVVELARKCTFCHGSGRVDLEWDSEGEPTKTLECGECEGAGGFVTDEGQAILDLIESYGKKGKYG